MEWKPISTASFDRELELAIFDYDGTHVLVFPCHRIIGRALSSPPLPSARAVYVRTRPQHGPTNANSINSPVRLAESSSTGNSYRRGRSGLAWYGGNNDALKLLMSSV
jgi:hypothetical protein